MAIRIECKCGKTLKVDEKYRGKKAKCPACGRGIVVEEGEDTGMQADEPKKRPVKVADEPDDDDGEPEEKRKPAKKKVAKRGMMPWVLGGCGVLSLMTCCLASAGVGVWYFWFSGPPDDLKFVHDGVAGFVSFRAADVWKNPAQTAALKKTPGWPEAEAKLKEFEGKLGNKIEDVERVNVIFRSFDFVDQRNNQPDMVITVKTTKAMDKKKILDVIEKESNQKQNETKFEGGAIHTVGAGRNMVVMHWPTDKLVLFSPREDSIKDSVRQAKKSPKSVPLSRGVQMASSSSHQFVAAFDISSNLMNKLPAQALQMAPNLREMNGVIFASTMTKDLATMELVLTFPNAGKAESAKKDVEALKSVAMLGINAMGPKVPAPISKFMDSITIEQRSAEVVAKAKFEMDLDAFGPMNPFLGGFGGGNRIASTNNLKNIGLAMHSFHDVHKRLPNHAILHPKTGQPILSWRVALLPYLDQGPLYNQIKRDEPWNSPHNMKFATQMPNFYLLPGKPNDGRTYYQVFKSMPGSIESAFPQRIPPQPPFGEGGPMTLAGMQDGSSNTILVVESASSVNWMAPDEIMFQSGPAGFPSMRLGNHWGDNTFLAGMGDGTVRRFMRTITTNDMQALITARGGEAVDWPRWEAR